MIKPGFKTTEFFGVMAYFVYIILSTAGIISPEIKNQIDINVTTWSDAITLLAEKFGNQTILGGILWAYIKRRHEIKMALTKNEKL